MNPLHALHINSAPHTYHCEPGWNWNPPALVDYDLWHVLSGRGTMAVEDQIFTLGAGVTFLWGPKDRPRGTQDPANPLVVFAVHFDFIKDLPQDFAFRGQHPTLIRDTHTFATLAHRCELLWSREALDARAEAARLLGCLLWQLWDEALHPPQAEAQEFQALAAQVRLQPGKPWQVDDMAAYCHLSRAQFARKFKSMFGVSALQYVLERRIERARQLLTETDMDLGEIARALGYADVFYFSRQFKQFTGMAPGLWRRQSHLAQKP